MFTFALGEAFRIEGLDLDLKRIALLADAEAWAKAAPGAVAGGASLGTGPGPSGLPPWSSRGAAWWSYAPRTGGRGTPTSTVAPAASVSSRFIGGWLLRVGSIGDRAGSMLAKLSL